MGKVAERLDARLRAVAGRARERGRAWLSGVVAAEARATLAPRREDLAEARAGLTDARAAAAVLATRIERDLARLDVAPLGPSTTVHAAHWRHPGVQAVFARHGLPRCPDCAVGRDETLAEAAWGEGFELAALLEELHALPPAYR